MKSGGVASTTTGSQAPWTAVESEVFQLVTASEWWTQAVQDYWKTAPRAQLLQPQLEAALAEARSPDQAPPLTMEPWQI